MSREVDSSTSNTSMESQHGYIDYSGVNEEEVCLESIDSNSTVISKRKDESFPVKLHYLLRELEKDGMDDIIHWLPHGRAFIIAKRELFEERLLPLWFQQTKFGSFQRQLNIYDFKRITTGDDKGGYYHPCFLRSKQFLARRIKRNQVKGTGWRKPNSEHEVPNFYEMPYLPREDSVRGENASHAAPRPAPIATTPPQNGPEDRGTSDRLSLRDLLQHFGQALPRGSTFARSLHLANPPTLPLAASHPSLAYPSTAQINSNLQNILRLRSFDAGNLFSQELIEYLQQQANDETLELMRHYMSQR